jgi:2-hydroxychromene-2-carboxylate isomerase
MPSVSFYFDLGSPYAYLAAERLETVLAGPVRWQPILLGGLFRLTGRSSWALGDQERRRTGQAEIERRGRDYGLPALRWPDRWPTDYLFAMRAATYALASNRGREFALQGFRDAFQGGADLSQPSLVLRAGQQVGLETTELEAAARDPEIKAALRDATAAAFARGVIGVPTVAIDDALFWGEDRLLEAADYLARLTAG